MKKGVVATTHTHIWLKFKPYITVFVYLREKFSTTSCLDEDPPAVKFTIQKPEKETLQFMDAGNRGVFSFRNSLKT